MPNFSGDRRTFGGSTGGTSGKGNKGRGRNDKPGGNFGLTVGPLAFGAPPSASITDLSPENVKTLLDKPKKTESGSNAGNIYKKPGEENMAAAEALASRKPLSDVEKAVLESRRQRRVQGPGLDVAQTLLGMLPSNVPMGAAFGLGRWMGKKTEEDASKNPDNYRTDPKDPGSLYSKSGPVSTNRAIDLPSNKKNISNAGGETLKKKKPQLPTLLGASANPLGTFSNPVMIT